MLVFDKVLRCADLYISFVLSLLVLPIERPLRVAPSDAPVFVVTNCALRSRENTISVTCSYTGHGELNKILFVIDT